LFSGNIGARVAKVSTKDHYHFKEGAMTPRLKITLNRVQRIGIKTFLTLIIFSIVMSNGVGNAMANTNPRQESASSSTLSKTDITHEINLGNSQPNNTERVPVLSEQIANQAKQNQEEKSVKLNAWAEPAIYIPGELINLNWKVENLKPEDLVNTEVVIHAPDGSTTTDPNPMYTPDGLITIPLQSKKDGSNWNVDKVIEFPTYFELDLLVNHNLVTSETVMINKAQFTVEKDKGGTLKGLNGKVEVEVPANATDDSLDFDIRPPAPNTQPGVSLTWNPLEIIAVGKNSHKNVNKFKNPIKITVHYDPTQIFDWDENALSIYYYDQDQQDWFPMETTVDVKHHTLTAYSDHLTVFDYQADHWQSQDLPTVDTFKVSDFTGAATYALNLWAPPGPGGLQPSLALTYNSQIIDESSAFSQSSWAGMGWDLNTGAIIRNMHGTDTDTSDDTFSISAGGVSGLLLPISNTVVGSITTTTFNTADQSFMKVEHIVNTSPVSDTWKATSTDGTQYAFGSIARTSISDTDGCATAAQLDTIWRWSLTTITDTHTNQLTYAYTVEQKNPAGGCYNEIAVYPASISYPNGKYTVLFDTEARNDYQTSWTTSASKIQYGTKRLNQIRVQNAGVTVRRYDLTYALDTEVTNIIYPNFLWSHSNAKTLTLVGVQEISSDDASPALPAVSFTYGDNMHVTTVNNGQGGQVQMTYQRWTYFDDANKELRSLKTTFGAANNECYGGGAIPTLWAALSTPVRCDGGSSLLQVGAGFGNPIAVGERPLPENMVKPGGRYRFHINVRAISNTTDTNWGIRDTGTNQVALLRSTTWTSGITTTGNDY
jgi:hypothetical protein